MSQSKSIILWEDNKAQQAVHLSVRLLRVFWLDIQKRTGPVRLMFHIPGLVHSLATVVGRLFVLCVQGKQAWRANVDQHEHDIPHAP